jgi:peroxiredoxin
MSVKSQMAALRSKVARELPEGVFDKLNAEAANLRVSGKWRGALKAGEAAPDFKLPNRTGGISRLSELLKAGPVIVSFYRGDWCRFCRIQLQALADIAGDVRALGATLIAIAPQTAVAQKVTWVANPPLLLLGDPAARVCKAYGLTFLPADDLYDAYTALGRPAGEVRHLELPVPAMYIVDPSGIVVFSYIDSDFTNRLEPCEVLDILRRLRSMRDVVSDRNAVPQKMIR